MLLKAPKHFRTIWSTRRVVCLGLGVFVSPTTHMNQGKFILYSYNWDIRKNTRMLYL